MGARMQTLYRSANAWTVELQTGEKISTRLLIGADGRKSRVAKLNAQLPEALMLRQRSPCRADSASAHGRIGL